MTTKLQSMATGSKHSFYFQSANQVPDSVDIPFSNQYRFTMKPATQVAVDYLGNVIKDFPFNMKAFIHMEMGHLSKSTRRNALSLSRRVTSTTSGQGQQVIYKMSQSVEETASVSSTTTMHPNDLTGQETKSNTSDSSNGDSLEDETKSVSVVPDLMMEDDIDDISLKLQHSPVFGVQAPNSFSTEYPGDWSEDLISDPDNLLERCDDMDVTKTLDDDKSVGSTNLPQDAGNVLE